MSNTFSVVTMIFINDIDADLDADTTSSLFANDTATKMKYGRIKECNRMFMQKEINKIIDWETTWKMSVNEDKNKAMVFLTSNADLKWDPKFKTKLCARSLDSTKTAQLTFST